MNFKYSHILWDWNGTLVDDIDLCISVTNELLTRRERDFQINRDIYLSKFTFPVVDFYHAIGWDFSRETFAEMAEEWIIEYKNNFADSSTLNGDVAGVLNELRSLGFKQSILSACEENLLNHSIRHLQLDDFFHNIHGTGNNHASGKVDLALSIIEEEHCSPEESLLFGDTVHDWEVAEAAGIDCVLIANGHQHINRLESTGAPVIRDISEVPNFLKSL